MAIRFTKRDPNKKYEGFLTRSIERYLHKKASNFYKRKNTIRPSEIGYCVRGIVMSILNLLPPEAVEPRIQRIFDNGDGVHRRYLREYLKYIDCKPMEVEVEERGKTVWKECIEKRFELEEMWLKGSPDAIVNNVEDNLEYILELKSIKQEQFNVLHAPLKEHIWQAHCYMLMTGIPRAVLLYENKNTQAMKEFVINQDDNLLQKMVDKIKLIQRSVEEYEMLGVLPELPRCKEKYCSACRNE